MKIVYIVESLATTGGVERMITEKANYLSDNYGYCISIIVCSQHTNQPNYFSLSDSVNQICLSIPLYSQYRYKYPLRLWVKYKTNKLLKSALSSNIQQLNPDIIIGVGHFKANIICSFDSKAIKIIECHEARFYTHSGFSQHQNLFSKLFQKYYRKSYFKTIETKADVIVTLTQGDKKLWGKAKQVIVIPNFSTIPINSISNCDTKRIISVGRLSWEKGYDRLIKIWSIIEPRYSDWNLDIYGEGELANSLNEEITDKGIHSICIHKFTKNINIEYSKSSIFVMTSHYEGFPLVLLEAMKHGVPCIAFDCPFGPSSIIEDNKSGFLVQDDNINSFAEKLSLLIEDGNLRKKFSKAAIKRSEEFNIDRIMEQWKNLFENLQRT